VSCFACAAGAPGNHSQIAAVVWRPVLASTLTDVATVAAVPIGLLGLYLAWRHLRNQNRERGAAPKTTVHAIRWWRGRNFEQGFGYLGQYATASQCLLEELEDVRAINRDDLSAWGGAVLLTAAARISRYSQGKANLFVVNEVDGLRPTRSITLRSKHFVGPFPIAQLTTARIGTRAYRYREMPVSASATATVAASAAFHDRITFAPIGQNVSDQEKRLGTTHILAIPVCAGITDVEVGDFAVITVDFRLPRRVRALWICECWFAKETIMKRADRLQAAARRFVQAEGQITRGHPVA
jgi:hypothetical protein